MTQASLQWLPAMDPRIEAEDTCTVPLRDEATVRVVIPGVRVKRSGNLVRLGLQALPKGLITVVSGHGYILGRVAIGHQSPVAEAGEPGAEPWDTDGPPTPLTFGGDASAVVRAGEPLLSDPAVFALESGRTLVLSLVFSGHGSLTARLPAVNVNTHAAAVYIGPGRAAQSDAAPRGLALAPAVSQQLPFLAALEVAVDEDGLPLTLPPLARRTPALVQWDGQTDIPADTEVRWRIPATAIDHAAGLVRLCLQRGAVAWSVAGAAVGLAVDESSAFAGEPLPVLFDGAAGVTVPAVGEGDASPLRSDAVALNIREGDALVVALQFEAAAAVPWHARGLADAPADQWPWWHRPSAASPWTPGSGAPLALAGLDGMGALADDPARPVRTVYEVLGGNAAPARSYAVTTLPAGSTVRLLLPRQHPPGMEGLESGNNPALASATQARLTLFWHDLPWTFGRPDSDGHTRCWSLDALRLGFAARPTGEGSPFVFEAGTEPVAVPFPGRAFSAAPLVVDGPLVSDWCDLPRPWTPTDRLLLELTLRQPLALWPVSGGYQALWTIWPAAHPVTTAPAPWPGCQPFVRTVEVR